MGSFQHLIEGRQLLADGTGYIGDHNVFQVFFRIIDSHFQAGNEIGQLMAHGADDLGQAAFELIDGTGQALTALGLDNIHDGFGLGQIDAAVDKSPLRKFSGIGQTGAVGQDQAEDFFQGFAAAVALDFQYVFCRIGMGALHDEHQYFIDRAAVIGDDETMLDGTVPALGQGFSGRTAENGVADRISMAAADTDDADTAFPQRSGNGRNRIGRIVHRSILLSYSKRSCLDVTAPYIIHKLNTYSWL